MARWEGELVIEPSTSPAVKPATVVAAPSDA
jgi:hypothetical protein